VIEVLGYVEVGIVLRPVDLMRQVGLLLVAHINPTDDGYDGTYSTALEADLIQGGLVITQPEGSYARVLLYDLMTAHVGFE
jgi:hypothetical protein